MQLLRAGNFEIYAQNPEPLEEIEFTTFNVTLDTL